MRGWMLVAASALVASAASAQEIEVKGKPDDVLFVWKDIEAAKNGAQLITAGVSNADAYRGLVACPIPAGTKVVVTKAGRPASEIIVSSGPRAGCKGVLPNFQLP